MTTSICCLQVLYTLDTCRLQVTKVTKGALNASQSEEARDSICLARPEHLHRGSFYSKFLPRALALLKGTPVPRKCYILTKQVILFRMRLNMTFLLQYLTK